MSSEAHEDFSTENQFNWLFLGGIKNDGYVMPLCRDEVKYSGPHETRLS